MVRLLLECCGEFGWNGDCFEGLVVIGCIWVFGFRFKFDSFLIVYIVDCDGFIFGVSE